MYQSVLDKEIMKTHETSQKLVEVIDEIKQVNLERQKEFENQKSIESDLRL